MPDPARIQATVSAILAVTDGPVRVGDLVKAGIAPGRIRAAVAAGHLLCLRRGIVQPRATWEAGSADSRHRWALAAALIAYPESFASHESAARLHGLPILMAEPENASEFPMVHVTRLGAARTDGWLRVHGCDTPPRFVTVDGDVSVTDLVRTSIELAATRSLRGSVAMIDAAMRRAILDEVGVGQLRAAVLDAHTRAMAVQRWRAALGVYARHRWVTHVRQAVALSDPASESVLESMSRSELISAGLPRPRCGVPILGDDGRTYFGDLVWEDRRVIGEADGQSKYSGERDFMSEKIRQEALQGAGWTVVRWGWREGVTDPSIMIARVRRALATY